MMIMKHLTNVITGFAFIIIIGCNTKTDQNKNLSSNESAYSKPDSMLFFRQMSGSYVTSVLTLYDDSNFSEYTKQISSIDRSIAFNDIKGKFSLSGKKLYLLPEVMVSKSFEGTILKINGMDSISKTINYFANSYTIIKYKNLYMLLNDSIYENTRYTNDCIEIANSLNKNNGSTDLNHFYKNSELNNIMVEKDIANEFPSPWKEYVREEPLMCKVTDVHDASPAEKSKYSIIYPESGKLFKIDKGYTSGLYKGMLLYAKGKDSCDCKLWILDSDENFSVAQGNMFFTPSCDGITQYSTSKK